MRLLDVLLAIFSSGSLICLCSCVSFIVLWGGSFYGLSFDNIEFATYCTFTTKTIINDIIIINIIVHHQYCYQECYSS